jgi:uncharacterized lipoprotein YmbA
VTRHPIASIVILAALAGCASAPKEQYYTLSAATAATPIASLPDVVVAVGLARVSDVVDRPQLVIRASQNRVQILEQQRWAEPLKAGISRVVAENLGRLLGTARASGYPQAEAKDVTYRVTLDVQEFDSRPGEGVTVEIAWTVHAPGAGVNRNGRSSVTQPTSGPGYEGLVAAHSRALERVSVEIAQAIATAR